MTEVVAGGETLYPSHVISSLPLRTTVGIAEPEAPLEVRDAARGLRYREFLTVAARARGRGSVHRQLDLHPSARRARAADPELQVLEPVDGAQRHRRLDRHGVLLLRGRRPVEHGRRRPGGDGRPGDREAPPRQGRATSSSASSSGVHKAYPIYDELYAERVKTIRGWLEQIGNLAQVGRNGLHRYNNSDHSMLTAMRAVDNILLGTNHDIWAVNVESVYHEEHQENEDPYSVRRRRPRWSSRSHPSAEGQGAACVCVLRRAPGPVADHGDGGGGHHYGQPAVQPRASLLPARSRPASRSRPPPPPRAPPRRSCPPTRPRPRAPARSAAAARSRSPWAPSSCWWGSRCSSGATRAGVLRCGRRDPPAAATSAPDPSGPSPAS